MSERKMNCEDCGFTLCRCELPEPPECECPAVAGCYKPVLSARPNKYPNGFEPLMADGGKYSSNLMRGFLGKMDKQVLKIAASLHAIDNFQHSVTNLTISYDCILRAYSIYCELLKTFTKTADSEGYGGDESQIKHVANTLSGYISKGRFEVKARTLIDSIKKAKAFKSQTKITAHFHEKLMPVLQNRNICWYSEKQEGFIRINPKMAE